MIHRQEQCLLVAKSALQSKCLQEIEANYEKLRILWVSVTDRCSKAAWQKLRTKAPEKINVAEPLMDVP